MRLEGVEDLEDRKVEKEAPGVMISGISTSTWFTAGSKLRILWVVLYYCIMTVIMTWPLIGKMGRSMVGQVGDNIYFVWMIAWIKKAIFELGVNHFRCLVPELP